MKRLIILVALIALLVAPSALAYSYSSSYSGYGSSYYNSGIWMGQTNERIPYAPPGSRYGYGHRGYSFGENQPFVRGYSRYGAPLYAFDKPNYYVQYNPYGYNYVQSGGHAYRPRWY